MTTVRTTGVRPPVSDVLLALALTGATLPLLWLSEPADPVLGAYDGPDLVAVLLAGAMTLPVAWRRTHPRMVLVAVALATVVGALWPIPFVGLGLLVAVYTVAAHRPRRDALLALLGVLALLVGLLLAIGELRFLPGNLLVFCAAWLFGDWRRLQQARAEELRRRARTSSREREERARLAVSRERERIAVDLWDVLAHGITEMVAQAQAADRLLHRDVSRAKEALQHVETSGRAALTELRRLVGLLRADDGDLAAGPTGTEPTPLRDAVPSDPGGDEDRGRWAPAAGAGLERLRAHIRRLPVVVQDLGVVVLVLAVELPHQWREDLRSAAVEDFAGPSVATVALVLLLVGALAWRRYAPRAVLAVTLVASLGVVAWSVPAQLLAPLIALYTVAAHCPRRRSLPWLALIAAITVGVLLSVDALRLAPGQLVTFAIVWLLGDWQRVRRGYEHQLEERASRLEQARTREAELAVSEERARIARELHDVVAQTIGVMLVQAGAARTVAADDPDRAREAVASLLQAGRRSLGWLRETVDVLGGAGAAFAPQPGLEDLASLVAGYTTAGLDVELRVEGAERTYSRGVALSAYRIVQESLTNVLRHAQARHAEVRIVHGDELRIEVVDDGRGPGGSDRPPEGHGLIGMRERARLVGGDVEAGARPGGGFRVSARLPAAAPAEPRPAELVGDR